MPRVNIRHFRAQHRVHATDTNAHNFGQYEFRLIPPSHGSGFFIFTRVNDRTAEMYSRCVHLVHLLSEEEQRNVLCVRIKDAAPKAVAETRVY